ncbi:MAG TPA: class I SAM-dependent methyltransferase, partial [Thermoplasmata archaeon]|nr:class I SAM-dependent methyltransferase [Thermoplasmata archaeon]
MLGPVRGRDVLELGCGSAYWSAGLRKRGARTVGIDLSRPRLLQALRVQRTMRTAFPLVRCDAERLPFRDRSFDVAFADWGAFTFSDPHRAIPEAARILRVGGVLVLATGSPWRALAQTGRMGRLGRTLRRDYFGLTSTREPDLTVFHLGYSDWVRL